MSVLQPNNSFDLPPAPPNFSPMPDERTQPLEEWMHDHWIKVFFIWLFIVLTIGASTDGSVGLALGTLIVGGTYFGMQAARRQTHSTEIADTDARNRHMQAAYEAAYKAWWWLRPFNIVMRDPSPIVAARSFARANASAYVAMSPENKHMVMIARDHSILVLGPSRWGKTDGVNGPMLLMHLAAAVATSTKRDLFYATYRVRMGRGRVWVFDPSGEWSTSDLPPGVAWLRWSPLWSCRTWDSAKRTAVAMIGATPVGQENPSGDVHWVITAEQFLAPLLFAAALHQECTMVSVRRWVNGSDFVTPLAILQAVAASHDHPCRGGAEIAIEVLVGILNSEPRHRSSVVSTTGTVTNVYNSESVSEVIVNQNFEPEDFVRSTDTVYIASSSRKQAATAPLIAGFIDAIQAAAYDLNLVSPFMKSDSASVLLLLDEVANIAPIKALPSYLSEGGSQGLQTVVSLQTLSQAEIVWPVQGKSLLQYFATKVVTGGIADPTTNEALSMLVGDHYRQYVSRSDSTTSGTNSNVSHTITKTGLVFGRSTSTTYSTGENFSHTIGQTVSEQKQRILSPADIAALPKGTVLIIDDEVRRTAQLVGLWSDPWQSIINNPTEPIKELAPPTRVTDNSLPELVPLVVLIQTDEQRNARFVDLDDERELRAQADDDWERRFEAGEENAG